MHFYYVSGGIHTSRSQINSLFYSLIPFCLVVSVIRAPRRNQRNWGIFIISCSEVLKIAFLFSYTHCMTDHPHWFKLTVLESKFWDNMPKIRVGGRLQESWIYPSVLYACALSAAELKEEERNLLLSAYTC